MIKKTTNVVFNSQDDLLARLPVRKTTLVARRVTTKFQKVVFTRAEKTTLESRLLLQGMEDDLMRSPSSISDTSECRLCRIEDNKQSRLRGIEDGKRSRPGLKTTLGSPSRSMNVVFRHAAERRRDSVQITGPRGNPYLVRRQPRGSRS